MTREKAHEKHDWKWAMESPDIGDIIDEIYDDFEGRTCENCKAWSCEIHCEVLDIRTHEDFGCNYFERKDT